MKWVIFFVYILLILLLLALSVYDIKKHAIPNGISLTILLLGIITTIFDWTHLNMHLLGLFAVSLPLFLCYWISNGRAIGGGDIKLMGAAGLLIGWQKILLAFLIAGSLAFVVEWIKGRVVGKTKYFAFGPYLSIGILAAIVWGNSLIYFYMITFS